MQSAEELAKEMQDASHRITDELIGKPLVRKITNQLPVYKEGIKREQAAWSALIRARDKEIIHATIQSLIEAGKLRLSEIDEIYSAVLRDLG